MELQHYLHVVRRNAVLIVSMIVVLVALAAFQDARQPKVYEAKAEIVLRPENLTSDPLTSRPLDRFDGARFARVEVAVIDSAAIATAAAERLEAVDAQTVITAVSATLDEAGGIATVRATARVPERSAAIANAVVDAYVEYRRSADVGAIERAIEELASRLVALDERIAELEQAERSPDPGASLVATRQQYATVFARQQDLLVQASLQRPTAEVLSRANTPGGPIGIGAPAKAILAALLGAALGLVIAFARDQLDDRVRSREEIQDLIRVPILGDLPLDRRAARSDTYLPTADDALSEPFGEAMRSLRTNIGFVAANEPGGIRRLLVTSPAAGEGKTIVSANLAVTYAQAGHRTMLISADLRRPRLEAMFGITPGSTPGLASVFALGGPAPAGERHELRQALRRATRETRIPGLWLLPAGTPAQHPAELLSSSRMDEVLDVLSSEFDMVIVDTSPLLPVTDGAALAPKVGHVLVVASMSKTHRRALVRAAEIVHSTRAVVVGVALNKVSADTMGYGRQSYSGYPRGGRDSVEGVPATSG